MKFPNHSFIRNELLTDWWVRDCTKTLFEKYRSSRICEYVTWMVVERIPLRMWSFHCSCRSSVQWTHWNHVSLHSIFWFWAIYWHTHSLSFDCHWIERYLCLSDLKNANTIYQLWKERFPTLDTPLMNFLNFLLQTLERDALPLFVLLRQKYKKTLERDQYFNQVLWTIQNNKKFVFYHTHKHTHPHPHPHSLVLIHSFLQSFCIVVYWTVFGSNRACFLWCKTRIKWWRSLHIDE